MRRKAELILGLVFGVLATIGGWWFLLSMFDLTPVFINEYTILNLILGLVTMAALLCSLALAGPFVLWDSIKSYREGSQE